MSTKETLRTIIWGGPVRLHLVKTAHSVESSIAIKSCPAILLDRRIRTANLASTLEQLLTQETGLILDVSRTCDPWAMIWCGLQAETVQEMLVWWLELMLLLKRVLRQRWETLVVASINHQINMRAWVKMLTTKLRITHIISFNSREETPMKVENRWRLLKEACLNHLKFKIVWEMQLDTHKKDHLIIMRRDQLLQMLRPKPTNL